MAGLTGMKAICAHEGNMSEPTILKWIREYDYPAEKVDGVWLSDTDLANDWRKKMITKGRQKTNK